ncbi:UNVERIFIED_CONTAM: hypothetical protein GTU68_063018 [Idotea baltica]|nr:hypothetical protein [Idotea baltica]
MHVRKHMKAGVAFRTMFKLNQKGGIDCPGCAWPDPDDDRSRLGEYCENGMKAIAEEATRRSIGASFFQKYSVQELSERSDYELGKFGRLTEPMALAPGGSHYEPISWEAAFSLIGKELCALESPDEAIFYTSGRTSNEAAFLYQLFVRQFGTNNMPDCSNMCHESSGSGLSQTLGIGKGSVTLQDLHEAELIMVMGQNPGTNHPRMLSALEKCKEGGGKIIAVNPLPEAGLIKFTNPQSLGKMFSGGTKLSDLHLPVAINGDIALLKAIMLILWEKEQKEPGTIFDHDFITEYTAGYADFLTHLKTHDLTTCIKQSGVDEGLVREAAEMISKRKKIIICWAMGLTQHENGVQNIREIVNLLLLKGAVGKPGAGTCPVRGHSNVQGDRTMGIWESPPSAFLDRLEKHFRFQAPRKHGFGVVEAIEAMYKGQSSVFIALGGNFISATPDTEYTAEALQSCSLTVQISTKLNRSHLVHGRKALILPCLGRTDRDVQNGQTQFVTVENSMGVVHSSQGILKPQSKNQLSEPAIIAGMAKATLGSNSTVDWDALAASYDLIREGIQACIPGFENFNQRARNPSGFYLPNGARVRSFNTDSGKANFSGNDLPENELRLNEFTMMTIRSHDQYNTTIYGLDDRYRGISNGRRVVLVNERDLEETGLKSGMYVDIVGVYKGKKRIAKKFLTVIYPIPSKCIATYFPEANVLVPIDSFDRISKTPASKRVVVKMVAHRET